MERRKFLRGAAGALGSGLVLLGHGRYARGPSFASDDIRIGVIGVGSRGQELIRYFLRVPGVKITALCDIYEPRLAAGRDITKEQTPVFDDYRRLLETRDLDAVVVATPLYLHREHMTASLDSGRHVYGEKSLGFTLEHCDQIVEAVRRSGKLFQVGHQYHYASWYDEVVRRVRGGEIGKVTHVFGYWHRNHDWRRPVPEPKLERLINWRMYKEYSGGLMAELGSHQIDIVNWIFGSEPESVVGSGGIDFYKDGRETNDNVQAIFRYPGGATFTFSALTTNAKMGNNLWIYGASGAAELTIQDGAFYYEAKRGAAPASGTVTERGVPTGATYRTGGEMPYRGSGARVKPVEGPEGNPNYVACKSFIDSLRQNKRPLADEMVGWRSAVSVCLANKAIAEGQRMNFSDHLKAQAASAPSRS